MLSRGGHPLRLPSCARFGPWARRGPRLPRSTPQHRVGALGSSRAAETVAEEAVGRIEAVIAIRRLQQRLVGAGEIAVPRCSAGTICEICAIGAGVAVRGRKPIGVPLDHVAHQVELPPLPRPELGRADRRDVVKRSIARAGTVRITAVPNRVLVGLVRRGRPPRKAALLSAPGRGVYVLSLAG